MTSLEWITNEVADAHVTIDNQRRLYVSQHARRLLGLSQGSFRLIVGYDHDNQRILLAKPELVRVPGVRPFKFDKRAYASAKPLLDRIGAADLPARFVYRGVDYADYPEGSHCFERVTR